MLQWGYILFPQDSPISIQSLMVSQKQLFLNTLSILLSNTSVNLAVDQVDHVIFLTPESEALFVCTCIWISNVHHLGPCSMLNDQ